MNWPAIIDVFKHMLVHTRFAAQVSQALQDELPARGMLVRIKSEELWISDGLRLPLHISVITGSIWLTQEGDARDILLRAGQSYASSSAGKVVLQALRAGYVRIVASGDLAQSDHTLIEK